MKSRQLFTLTQMMLLMVSLSFGRQSISVSQSQSKSSNQEKILTVSYCELMKNPELMGKLVRVKAIWAYGFEWSCLYSRECRSLPAASFEFDEKENLCTGTLERRKELEVLEDGFAEVVLVGRLRKGIDYLGHRGYQFIVACLEDGKRIFPEEGHLAP